MHIGIMLRHYEQHEGGVKHYTSTLLPLLFTLGAEHRYVLIYQNPKLLGTYAAYPNVEELVSRVPGTILWDQLAVPWVTRHRQLDIIFNPKFTVPLLHPARKIFVLHGSEWFAIPRHFKWYDRVYCRTVVPWYCHRADAFIAVANKVKEDAVRYVRADPEKIFPIHNAIDPRQFHLIEDEARLTEVRVRHRLPEKFVLWVGQIESRKNVKRLLRAFAAIASEFPHQLVIAGEQRWSTREELSEVGALGLEQRIQFLGWVPHTDLPAIYRLAELLAFPSLYEGFGIPLVEAMACGCPILTANTCAPPEVVDGAGYLVDPYDVDAIAAGLRITLSDPALRAAMIARGLERAKAFSWEKSAREVLGVFDAVAGARTHAAGRRSAHA
ncbi:MAG TPA: glycosyltransferase family 1 protein [Steroidobacteraceae bacterium]|nr:glycosyltransferase family 1 protein [Steroidobacteraceae bacterium]